MIFLWFVGIIELFILCMFMDKKALVIKVLDKLSATRDLADGIIALLTNTQVDEQTIDWLIHIINKSMHTVQSQQNASALQKSLDALHKIQDMQANDWTSDAELQAILDTID